MICRAEKIIFPFIAAIGLGCMFQVFFFDHLLADQALISSYYQAPLVGLQAAMPVKDMATSTATFGFLRTLGGTVGVAIGQAIYSSVRIAMPKLCWNCAENVL